MRGNSEGAPALCCGAPQVVDLSLHVVQFTPSEGRPRRSEPRGRAFIAAFSAFRASFWAAGSFTAYPA